MTDDLPPAFVLDAFRDLQRRRVGLGPSDLTALRSAMRAGFGWGSQTELTELCVALWASTPDEADLVRALLGRDTTPRWELDTPAPEPTPAPHRDPTTRPAPPDPAPVAVPPPVTDPTCGLPPLPELALAPHRAVLAARYPVTRRMIGQAFRRLRRPEAVGPPTQLDVEATLARRVRSGVATPPVLVPRRRNRARLLLLIDRQGSMTPFHPYADHVRDAIISDGGLERADVAYFHDTPADRADPLLLDRLRGPFPALDPVLDAVEPSLDGAAFSDPALTCPIELDDLVEDLDPGTGVVVLSDAGAARGRFDATRTLATVAVVRGLRAAGHRVVWLNPVATADWAGSGAAQLARHVPMLPLDGPGLHRAVDVLRGRPMTLERAA